MLSTYLVIKAFHILSSTVLFGTGIGIAFFMFKSLSSNNELVKLVTVRNTVLADTVFTLPAAIIQPLTGLWLIIHGGFNWSDKWLLATYFIYLVVGVCWVCVVFIQISLRNMLAISVSLKAPLPDYFQTWYRIWFFLGWPAFIGLIIIYFLMVVKPI